MTIVAEIGLVSHLLGFSLTAFSVWNHMFHARRALTFTYYSDTLKVSGEHPWSDQLLQRLILNQLSVLGGSLGMKHINSKPNQEAESGAMKITTDTSRLLKFASR